jgi:hypothetical protein
MRGKREHNIKTVWKSYVSVEKERRLAQLI